MSVNGCLSICALYLAGDQSRVYSAPPQKLAGLQLKATTRHNTPFQHQETIYNGLWDCIKFDWPEATHPLKKIDSNQNHRRNGLLNLDVSEIADGQGIKLNADNTVGFHPA